MAERSKQIAAEIVEVLVPYVVTKKRSLSYGDLSRAIKNRFGDNVPAWHAMAKPLGLVQDACKELGLPNLPVMVTDQQTGNPSSGWYDYFDELNPDLALLDPVEKRSMARDEVLACEDWSPLFEYYGIKAEAPAVEVSPETTRRLYIEGAQQQTIRIREESKRSVKARADCLEIHGASCAICGFNSEEVYGIPGIIDVHHLHPLAGGEERATDAEKDLIPVCPTCHRIIHSKKDGIYTPGEVKKMLEG